MRKKFFTLLVFTLIFFIFPSSLFADEGNLVINEFSSYDSDDWVEIYNNGDSIKNLSAYFLQDDAGNSKPLTGEIQPHEFAVFGFGKSLDKQGDIIRLLRVDDESKDVDKVAYGNESGAVVPAPESGQLAGRKIDGKGEWVIFTSPTKGKTNNGAQLFPTPTPTPTLTPTPTKAKNTPTPKEEATPTQVATPTETAKQEITSKKVPKRLYQVPDAITQNGSLSANLEDVLSASDDASPESTVSTTSAREEGDASGSGKFFISAGIIFFIACAIVLYRRYINGSEDI